MGRRALCWLVPLWCVALKARAEPDIRILLAETERPVQLAGKDLLVSLDYSPPISVRRRRLQVRFGQEGMEVVSGSKLVGKGQRLVAEADGAIGVGQGVYFGRIEIVTGRGHGRKSSEATVVNRIPMETYLLGIVGSEMPASWPAAALEAQAVAARTYALDRRLRMRGAGKPWDVRDSVLSQVYGGAESILPSVVEAVGRTRGVVLAFEHVPAEALFHSTCGGRTRSAEEVFGGNVPYLVPRRCRWCRDSARYRWDLSVPLSDLNELLEHAGLARGRVRRVSRRERAKRVTIDTTRGRHRLAPQRLRAALGAGRVYSSDFVARTRNRTLEMQGRGFGHQVGLCQWGARGMAEEGRDFHEILAHYYPEVPLKRAY
ncbi:MAG: SpoIID/LytB domain-containing protein [Myxococcota bacterium]